MKEFETDGPGIVSGLITGNPLYTTARKHKSSTELMKKQDEGLKVKCIAKAKINGTNMTMRSD
jgi:hypothetical protein